MIAQTILLRELLSQFAGSELYIGVIIGNWIAAEALGAFVAGRFMKDPVRLFPRFTRATILLALLFPVVLFLARTWRIAVALPLHEAVSLWQLLFVSIILIFPLALIHGGQFVLAASLYALLTGRVTAAPGTVYGMETVGTVIGGATASFLLIPLLSPFQTAALLLLVNGVIAFLLQSATPPGAKQSRRIVFIAPLLAAALLLSGGGQFLENVSRKLQWRGETLIDARNTPYQNIAVVRSGEQYTVYADGVPLLSLPYPDIARIEESVHLPLLAHPLPRRVLVLGAGASIAMGEILKHASVEWIDYVALDAAVVTTVEKYAPEHLLHTLHDPRVHIHGRDGRTFLRETTARYDLVLLDMPLPLNLQGNRYFTAEFFAAVKGALLPDGIVACSAAGSMSYYGDDLREITRSLVTTLRAVFPHLLIVPGEMNLFIASPGVPVEKLTAAELDRRLEARAVQTSLLSAAHLHWILGDIPLRWFTENIAPGGVMNSDFSPYILTRHLAYTTTRLNPEIKPVLGMLARVKATHLAILIVIATLGVILAARKNANVAVVWTIATTGFSAMLLELAFFSVFQLFNGVMLRTIGLLIALFMVGLWGGSRSAACPSSSPGGDRKRLFAGEMILLFLCGGLWVISSGGFLPASSPAALPYLLVLPLIFLAGFAAGVQFPSAARLTADASGPGTSGVYGFDLLGGWLGGLLGGALVLPLFGFPVTAQLLLVLKGGSILCLYLQGKRDRIEP